MIMFLKRMFCGQGPVDNVNNFVDNLKIYIIICG